MDTTELKAAAERLRCMATEGFGKSYGGFPMGEQGYAEIRDYRRVAMWALPLLSEEPVTAEWLRETWGAVRLDGLRWLVSAASITETATIRVEFDAIDSAKVNRWSVNGALVMVEATQGQFTMLALGIGLTPKTPTT